MHPFIHASTPICESAIRLTLPLRLIESWSSSAVVCFRLADDKAANMPRNRTRDRTTTTALSLCRA